MNWLAENLATILVGLVILGMVALAIRRIYRNKKAGKSCNCESGCGGCTSKGRRMEDS